MKRFLPISIFLFLVGGSFFAGKVYAAPQPVPPSGRIPCSADQLQDPNFDSSRPYQASPCGDSPKAIMCGNSLQVTEDVPGGTAPAGTPFKIIDKQEGNKDYAANVTGATFPIAGNTELTKNSQTTTDQIDNTTKMNEYLNWYLSGTMDKAESGVTDTSQTVDFAGPVKKLLPSMIQDAQRIDTIKSPKTQVTYTNTEDTPSDNEASAPTVSEPSNHNQIVVCARKKYSIPLSITNFLGLPSIGIGNEVPIDCYPSENSSAQGDVYRLSGGDPDLKPIKNNFGWNGSNLLEDITNWALTNLKDHYPNGFILQIVANMGIRWSLKIPPLPWDDGTGKPFASTILYQKAYNEWRGQLCAILPNLLSGGESLVCVGAWPWINNPYADLYPYVPLSNTVDHNAKTPITGVGIKGLGGTEVVVPDPAYKIIHEPILYYPHTQETSDLVDSLNKTYIPKTGTSPNVPVDSTDPKNDPSTGKCRIVELRSNPGDYLFPEVKPGISEVRVHVNTYIVHSVPCHDVTRTRPDGSEYIIAVCNGQVAIEIRMETKVPYADEVYASTTAGASSDFRKIYPKVGIGAPVNCISNIPSVTNVQYIPTENLNGMKVLGPQGDNTTDNPQLYFPHFGSVYDYFLKGIQTALRPQGYGDPTPESGSLCPSSQAP